LQQAVDDTFHDRTLVEADQTNGVAHRRAAMHVSARSCYLSSRPVGYRFLTLALDE